HEDGRETFGHSMIVDPWGRVVASAGGTGETVVLADVDIQAVKAAHDKIPNLKNGRPFTLDQPATVGAGAAA
ncbi:carbon-nitrogen hydrolase family protein, partial [Rhizobium sp. TRM95111]|uniref:nitrilase-related carbon-nitrogen hydrolase n=1 Tax=Rhizobium alarense TaxID=2846851 RepID=UPI002E33BA18